jgi:hypothetical protein
MKMSDEFTLPTAVESAVIVADDKYKAQFGGHMTPPSTANTTRSQNKSISHAVNNHDALVEALKSITKKLNWNGNGSCDYCGNEFPNHKDDCDYIAAINLLNKIKGP